MQAGHGAQEQRHPDGREQHGHRDNRAPVLVPSLFEPFRRMEARTASGGAGLGLAIARSVAAVHGTTVTARSRPDGGLDVEVTLDAIAPGTP